MKFLVVVLIVALVIVAGFLIFSGNNKDDFNINNSGLNTGVSNSDISENNTQTNTQNESSGNQTNQPQTYNIEIRNFAFQTKELTIKTGDTVIWTNKDSTSHTVTSDSGDELDSNLLSKDESYSHTFTEAETFSYHCNPHPGMKAKIILE